MPLKFQDSNSEHGYATLCALYDECGICYGSVFYQLNGGWIWEYTDPGSYDTLASGSERSRRKAKGALRAAIKSSEKV
jgi:hypothetical protein